MVLQHREAPHPASALVRALRWQYTLRGSRQRVCALASTFAESGTQRWCQIADSAASVFRFVTVSSLLIKSEQKLDEECDTDIRYTAWRDSAAGERAVASAVGEWQRLLVRGGVQSLTDVHAVVSACQISRTCPAAMALLSAESVEHGMPPLQGWRSHDSGESEARRRPTSRRCCSSTASPPTAPWLRQQPPASLYRSSMPQR